MESKRSGIITNTSPSKLRVQVKVNEFQIAGCKSKILITQLHTKMPPGRQRQVNLKIPLRGKINFLPIPKRSPK